MDDVRMFTKSVVPLEGRVMLVYIFHMHSFRKDVETLPKVLTDALQRTRDQTLAGETVGYLFMD